MMMWDRMVEVNLNMLVTDPVLISIAPNQSNPSEAAFYRNKSLPRIETPGVFWTVISTQLLENYEPCVVQWDIFAKDADTASQIERQIFKLMHSDLPVERGGLAFWSQYLDSWDLTTDNDESIYHRAVEYKYTPARYDG